MEWKESIKFEEREREREREREDESQGLTSKGSLAFGIDCLVSKTLVLSQECLCLLNQN